MLSSRGTKTVHPNKFLLRLWEDSQANKVIAVFSNDLQARLVYRSLQEQTPLRLLQESDLHSRLSIGEIKTNLIFKGSKSAFLQLLGKAGFPDSLSPVKEAATTDAESVDESEVTESTLTV